MRSLAFVLVLVIAAPADAQDARRARALFEQGVAAASAERWEEAIDRFRRSFELVERPATAFNLAVALDRIGDAPGANAALDDYFRVAPADDPRRADANALRQDLAARAPVELTLSVQPPDAIVEIDGQARDETGAERTYALAPGTHTLTVRAEGYATEMLQVEAIAGTPLVRAVDLSVPVGAAAQPPSAPGADPSPWILVGSSAAVLVAGAILLAVGRLDADSVENAPMGSSWADVAEAAERSPILSGTGIALMALGAVGTALGIVWAVQTPSGEVSVAPSGVRGTF